MSFIIQMGTRQTWVTHYHLTSKVTSHLSGTAYLLCLAENTETYFQQIEHYLEQHQLTGQAQLTPLPIQTWLTRHGFEAILWRAAQQLSPTHPILCVYDQEEMRQDEAHIDVYLHQQSKRFTPFTEFIESAVLPEEVRSIFFADFEGLGEYHKVLNRLAHKEENAKHLKKSPHFYAVVDCAKAVSFPSRLAQAGEMENLYTGKIGQTLEAQAPYLLEFDPYQAETVSFLQRLFRKSDNKVVSHWAINPVIFIKSEKPFNEVYHHLRKWTHLQHTETGEWYFFRFYDPLVLNRYLPRLAHYPAQLAALFGVNLNHQTESQDKIIEAFGVRVEEDFIRFSVTPLPEETRPARIALGEVEQHAMETMIIDKFKQQLIRMFEQNHPIRFRALKAEHKSAFVNHLYHAALAHRFVHPQDIAFFGHLMLYLGAHWYEDPIYHFIARHLHAENEIIDRRIEHITWIFNQSMPHILGENLENSLNIIQTLLAWYAGQSKASLSVNAIVTKLAQTAKPYFSRYVNEKHVMTHVRLSLENAQKQFGVTSNYQQSAWILLSLLLGIGFYRDPLMPWARDILMANNGLDEKMDALLKMLQKRANKMLNTLKEKALDV